MWDDLSIEEKRKYIKMGVESGLTNLEDIRDTYNSMDNTDDVDYIDSAYDYYENTFDIGGDLNIGNSGQLSYQNTDTNQSKLLKENPVIVSVDDSEEESSDKEYLINNAIDDYSDDNIIQQLYGDLKNLYYRFSGTPEYNTPSLRNAIIKAYDDGKAGEVILWNGKLYKAQLTGSDERKYAEAKVKRTLTGYNPMLAEKSEKIRKKDLINKEFSKYITSPNSSYQEAINWANNNGYIDYMLSQGRAIQKQRVEEALRQDPVNSKRPWISLKDTYSKDTAGSNTDLSALQYNPDIIDLIARNLPDNYDLYEALTLPIHETHLGQGNKRTNLNTGLGTIRSLINNHRYELGLKYFSDVEQHLKNVYRKSDGDLRKLLKEVYHIDQFKHDYPDLYSRMNEDAKSKFNEKRWNENNKEYTKVAIPYMRHALEQYKKGTYNYAVRDKYESDTKAMAKALRKSETLKKYLESQGYINSQEKTSINKKYFVPEKPKEDLKKTYSGYINTDYKNLQKEPEKNIKISYKPMFK